MRKLTWRRLVLGGLASVGVASGGCAQGPFPHSAEWYAERSEDPPGARQIDSHGKLWPPFARPVGRKQTGLHSYHYAHYWPYPHNNEDEAITRNVFDIQTSNGWLSATTLHDYHFNVDTQQLTEDGRAHLIWIVNSVPAQYRTVYVSQGASRDSAQMRMETIAQFFQQMDVQNPPTVLARAEVFNGRPAVEVDTIRQLELRSIPRPRLFYIGAATAAGGAGGAGAGVGAAGALGGQQGGGNSNTGSTQTGR